MTQNLGKTITYCSRCLIWYRQSFHGSLEIFALLYRKQNESQRLSVVKPGAYMHNSCLLGPVLIVTVYLHCVKLAQAILKKIIGFEKIAF